MKICFITHYSELYGANRSLIDLIRAILNHGDLKKESIHIVMPCEGELTSELKDLGIAHSTLKFDVDWYDPKSLKSILARQRRIKKRKAQRAQLIDSFSSIHPNIIHSNSSVFLLGAFIAEELNIPHVWHVREDIKGHYGRKYDSKCYALHYLNKAAYLLCTSAYINGVMRDLNLKNSVVLANIVSDTGGNYEKVSDKNFRLGVVGLFHPKKNQIFILNALKGFIGNKDVTLSFYGSGNSEIQNEIRARAEYNTKLKQKIKVKGFVRDIDRMYSEIDVLINLSEKEAFGRTTIEALQRGIPVIGLNSGATPDFIKNNINGFLIDKDAKELVRVVDKFIEDPSLIKKLGLQASLSAQTFTDPRDFAKTLMDIYNDALERHPIK